MRAILKIEKVRARRLPRGIVDRKIHQASRAIKASSAHAIIGETVFARAKLNALPRRAKLNTPVSTSASRHGHGLIGRILQKTSR